MQFPDITGWSLDCDRQFLYDAIVRDPKCLTIVEIGVYCGRMTVALAAAARLNRGIVHSVDPWKEMVDGADIARSFLDTVTRYDLQDVVRIHAESSKAFSERYNGPVDLAWIDGGHSYEDVRSDLECWHSRSRMFYGHDWHLPGVRKAAQEYAGNHGLRAVKLDNLDNIWTLL